MSELRNELVIDSFAGGGGASLGIARALGRGPNIAVNHDAGALAMHETNHPETRHVREDVWRVDLRRLTGGRPVGLLWASPDCRHFSRAKGGQPVSQRVRSLAWIVCRWADQVRPRIIMLENVRELKEAEMSTVEEELARLRDENSRLRAALAEYASAGNWGFGQPDVWMLDEDGYTRAREALK